MRYTPQQEAAVIPLLDVLASVSDEKRAVFEALGMTLMVGLNIRDHLDAGRETVQAGDQRSGGA